jgi:hypothetical protein
MVLTVSGATRSVTYRVSLNAWSLTPVDAQSRRCGRAPVAANTFQRSDTSICSYIS